MNTGLVKERRTVFINNNLVYQAFNDLVGGAKVFVYVNIGNQYVCADSFNIDHKILTDEDLRLIAIENERRKQ